MALMMMAMVSADGLYMPESCRGDTSTVYAILLFADGLVYVSCVIDIATYELTSVSRRGAAPV